MEVKEVPKNDWEKFAKNNKLSYTFSTKWVDFISSYLNSKCILLGVYSQNNLLNICPLVVDKKSMFSIPLKGEGGPAKTQYAELLFDYIDKLLKNNKYEKIYIGTKNKELLKKLKDDNYDLSLTSAYPIVDINQRSFNEIYKNQFKRDIKRNIKKAKNRGVKIKILRNCPKSLKIFYKNYCILMEEKRQRKLPFEFFRKMMNHMKEHIQIRVAYIGNKTLAVSFDIIFNGRYNHFLIVGPKYFKKYSPNTLIIADSIKYCCENNIKQFDFGPSAWNTSNLAFKKRFSDKITIHYHAIKALTIKEKIKHKLKSKIVNFLRPIES